MIEVDEFIRQTRERDNMEGTPFVTKEGFSALQDEVKSLRAENARLRECMRDSLNNHFEEMRELKLIINHLKKELWEMAGHVK